MRIYYISELFTFSKTESDMSCTGAKNSASHEHKKQQSYMKLKKKLLCPGKKIKGICKRNLTHISSYSGATRQTYWGNQIVNQSTN